MLLHRQFRIEQNAKVAHDIWIGSRAATNKLSSQDRSLAVGTGDVVELIRVMLYCDEVVGGVSLELFNNFVLHLAGSCDRCPL